MIKKILSILSAAAVLSSVMTALADDSGEISIVVNGAKINTDTAPVIINDRTMVPLRAIAESLGCDVIWNEADKAIMVHRNSHLYTFWIGYDTAFDYYNNSINIDNTCFLDSPPVIINDRTMIPIRAVSEMMGASVSWDDLTRTVNINVDLNY